MAEGIRKRHSKGCNACQGKRCNCKAGWEASIYLASEERKLRRSFTRESEARSWRADTQAAAKAAPLNTPSRITIEQAAWLWLEAALQGSVRDRSGHIYKPGTLREYARSLIHRVLPAFGTTRLSDLRRGEVQAFVDAMFGVGLRTRFRTDYFPFTEPSGDVSMECHICRGASAKPGGDPCRVCRSQGWIEIAGCGMVNPRVLVACGIDPDRYSGFAFGLGIERSLMIGHGLTEIRDAVEGDVRFSRAFGMEI